MAGKLIICLIAAFALIEPFNTLPAADNKQEVIYRNSKGEYYTSDGVILSDQYPIYWRHQNTKDPKNEHVVIVEPTVTYTRQAEYSSTQAAPATTYRAAPSTNFRASPHERESDFKPYNGAGRTESSAVAYYPYYVRASSNDRNEIEERRRVEESNKRVVIDANDPGYQRFVPREGEGHGKAWYYYSDTRPTTQVSSSSQPPPQPTLSSKSSVRFYFPNGTAIRTYYNEDDKQVMDIHPNQYVIQVTELTTTTTPRPSSTTDCPPFHPCNTVVYQQTTQCCKCYVVPNRCCSCDYSNNRNKK